ncbi:MAG: SDR family NAD(P)-dependent oxidoreductase [Gammaproteobacteria bacterium]|nr:SDR family NAD(P)-dependent oxidoreductase [Gammaproteobacteria bacterium]
MGKDFAKTLIKEGFIVYAAARRVEKMEELKSLGITPLKMDISQDNDIRYVVNTIEKQHGGIDVLINNAGFGLYGSVEETTSDEARYQFEVNLFGLARLTQLLLPAMRVKKAGTIINISSMLGRVDPVLRRNDFVTNNLENFFKFRPK